MDQVSVTVFIKYFYYCCFSSLQIRHIHHVHHPEFDRVRLDGLGDHRIQDQAECPSAGALAKHSELLLQRLVDHPSLQANEGLSEI